MNKPTKIALIIIPIVIFISVTVVGAVFMGSRQNFSSESFGVVLTNDATLAIIDQAILDNEMVIFTIAFFPELNISEVKLTSANQTENVRQQRMGNNPSNPVNQSMHRITLSVVLTNSSHRRVSRYVNIVNRRQDVYRASRGYHNFLH